MNDIDVVVKQELGKIEFNFDEIKEALKVQMSAYSDITVTEDEIPIYKQDLAVLRKIRKAVDDKRKEVKKEYNKPLDEFEGKVKELLAEIDKPIDGINEQLKLFEEDRIAHKRERISKLFLEAVGEYSEYLPYEKVYIEKWDNKSYSDSDIKYDISEMVVKVKNDLNIIKSLNSEIEDELLKAYKEAGNELSVAIQRNQQFISDRERLKALEEAKKEEVKEEPVKNENVLENTERTPLQTLNDFVEATKMVKVVVSQADIEQVKELLDFSQISYRIED